MEGNIATMVLVLLALAGSGAMIYGFVSRSQYLLHQWADQNQYQILHAEFRPLRKGPFWWASKNQVVYRVGVRDEQGQERNGWVRCGHFLMGMFANQVEVKWDDDQVAPR